MNRWTLISTEQLGRFLNGLSEEEKTKVKSIFLLFEEYGQMLPAKYLKRMAGIKELWELRAKRIRIFLVISGNIGFAVHGIIKKSQKTPKQDIELAVKRAIKAKKELI